MKTAIQKPFTSGDRSAAEARLYADAAKFLLDFTAETSVPARIVWPDEMAMKLPLNDFCCSMQKTSVGLKACRAAHRQLRQSACEGGTQHKTCGHDCEVYAVSGRGRSGVQFLLECGPVVLAGSPADRAQNARRRARLPVLTPAELESAIARLDSAAAELTRRVEKLAAVRKREGH